MFTITNKLRAIVAISAVGAAVASSGVASAATVVHLPGTGATTVAAAPAVVYLDSNKVGSAGQPGWDDAACQQTAQAANDWKGVGDQRGANGDLVAQARAYQIASDLNTEVEEHCIVQD
jgi:hypothetical protein